MLGVDIMPLTLEDAKNVISKNLLKGSKIIGSTEEGNFFLFLAINPDPLEGRFDPFYSVNKNTGDLSDFSPQDYPEPLDILNRLQA